MLYMRSVVSLINLKIYIGREMGIRLRNMTIYLLQVVKKETNIRFKMIYIRYSYDSMVFLKF